MKIIICAWNFLHILPRLILKLHVVCPIFVFPFFLERLLFIRILVLIWSLIFLFFFFYFLLRVLILAFFSFLGNFVFLFKIDSPNKKCCRKSQHDSHNSNNSSNSSKYFLVTNVSHSHNWHCNCGNYSLELSGRLVIKERRHF